eukprot:TRINITY_DN66478_c0_g1_i1.p1 TRINITY_DN66478_c0_g1~~TRINITY_DN66478_c0_g1_i1.p1  ORF type:complete len:268 (+),score=43.09 TRINITY_DN66478_c0_g1_i1:40-804(+)
MAIAEALELAKSILRTTNSNEDHSRRKEIVVDLEREDGETFGMNMFARRGMPGLIILDILDGSPVERWNLAHPDMELREGYVILKVCDGINLSGMMTRLNTSKRVKLLVRRQLSRQQMDSLKVVLETTVPPEFIPCLPQPLARDCLLDECAICLQHFDPDQPVLELPCRHAFHLECAREWLTKQSRKCPLCKTSLKANRMNYQKGRLEIDCSIPSEISECERSPIAVPLSPGSNFKKFFDRASGTAYPLESSCE